jgi:predicted HAD superfamily phosphohydrolase
LKINLNLKNEEILSNIPSKYRDLILNTILTKAIMKGDLFKELDFYLSDSEVGKIIDNIPIETLRVKKDIKYYSKNTKQQNIKKEINKRIKGENDNEALFIGFDD